MNEKLKQWYTVHGVFIIAPVIRRDAASMSSYFIFLGLSGSQNSSNSTSCDVNEKFIIKVCIIKVLKMYIYYIYPLHAVCRM